MANLTGDLRVMTTGSRYGVTRGSEHVFDDATGMFPDERMRRARTARENKYYWAMPAEQIAVSGGGGSAGASPPAAGRPAAGRLFAAP